MSKIVLTAEDLLAGANTTLELAIPPEILRLGQQASSNGSERIVKLRPLTIGEFQLIMKASREDAGLIPLLMIKEAVIEPELSLAQIKKMHLGLIEFLTMNIREVSGLAQKKSD